MIVGTKRWNDRDTTYFSQENNPTEALLRIIKAHEARNEKWGILETCGPTAATMCVAAVGNPVAVRCQGEWSPQPEGVLSDFFTDPRNYDEFRRLGIVPGKEPANEYASLYPFAVKRVFGAVCNFIPLRPSWDAVLNGLAQGRAWQFCLIDPGHFIAVVAADTDAQELIFNDPWPHRRPEWDGDGFNRRMSRAEYESNIKGYALLYGGAL